MGDLAERLGEWMGRIVVTDCASSYVAIGTLERVGEQFLELTSADMHDLRDTTTTREVYLMKTARFGVQSTRARVLIRMTEVVGISLLEDVTR